MKPDRVVQQRGDAENSDQKVELGSTSVAAAADKLNEEHSAFATAQDLANASYWQTGLQGSRYPAQGASCASCASCCVCMRVSVYVCVTLPSQRFKNANSRGAAGKHCS